MLRSVIFFVLVGLFSFTACAPGVQSDKPLIVATINPYYLLARQLAAPRCRVALLIPANASPHTFSPSPRDMVRVQQATLILANGLGLEGRLGQRLRKTGKQVVWAVASVPQERLLAADGHGAHDQQHQHDGQKTNKHKTHHGKQHGSADPHIWLDSRNLQDFARVVVRELIKKDKKGEAFYRKRLALALEELQAADEMISKQRAAAGQGAVLTFHNAFRYFFTRYNIRQGGAVVTTPGREPGPRYLADLGKRIRAQQVKVVFVEPQLDQRAARVIAREFGLKVDVLDPLGFAYKAKTPPEILLATWRVIRKYL